MPVVRMPDGALVELPDNPTPEQLAQIMAAAKRAVPPQPQPVPSPAVAQSPEQPSGNPLTRGLASLASGFGKTAALVPKAISMAMPMTAEQTANTAALADTVNDYWTKFGQQHGVQNAYGRAALEGVGGAPAGGAIGKVGLLAGAGAGVGGEVGAKLGGDNWLARFGGSLLGGMAAGGAASRSIRPQTRDLAAEAVEGISPDMLKSAAQFQLQAKLQGVDVDLSQALHAVGAPGSNLTTIRDHLAGRSHGTEVQRVLREQPGQLGAAADTTVGRMPGQNYGPLQTANNLQEAATEAVNQAKKARSAEVAGLYDKAKDLPPQARGELLKVLDHYARQAGNTSSVQSAIKEIVGKIKGESPELSAALKSAREEAAAATTPKARVVAREKLTSTIQAIEAQGQTPLRARDVDTWIGEFAGPFKGTPLSPADPKSAGQAKGVAGALNKRFQQLSPEVAAAEARFAELTEETVNPLKQSAVGLLATPRGYKPDVQASLTKFQSLMEQGVDSNATRSEIRTLGRELHKADPTAFQDAVKTYVSGKIRSAMEPGATASTAADNPDMAKRIATALWGNERQAQGLRDAVATIAEAHKVKPEEAVRGLHNLMQLTRALQSRPGSVGGLQPTDIAKLGGQSYGSDALRVFGFLPFEKAARRIEDAVLGRTLREFDQILTSPDGAQKLAELGRVPPTSNAALAILGTMGGQAATNPTGITRE